MDDLDAIDYSVDPMDVVSIWQSTYFASVGMYSSGFSGNFSTFSYVEPSQPHVVVLPDELPTWSSLSTPSSSLATLGFVSDYLNSNPGLDLPVSELPPPQVDP